MMTESLRRQGKLYISEMDPSTYLDENPHRVIGGHGGIGSDTLEGSRRILQRDLGQVFASGVGGWLYDFGPLNRAKDGWYASPEMIAEMKKGIAALEINPEVKTQAKMAMTMVGGVLDQLAAAESQEDLEAVIGGLMGMVMGM